MADGEEGAHERRHHREEGEHEEHDECGLVRSRRQAAKKQDHPIGHHRGEDADAVLLRTERLGDTGESGDREGDGAREPQDQLHPVAPEALSDQHGEQVHRGFPSCEARSSP